MIQAGDIFVWKISRLLTAPPSQAKNRSSVPRYNYVALLPMLEKTGPILKKYNCSYSRFSEDPDPTSHSSDEDEVFSQYEIERFKNISENRRKFQEIFQSKTKEKKKEARNLKPDKVIH